jgi:hypothetical protein
MTQSAEYFELLPEHREFLNENRALSRQTMNALGGRSNDHECKVEDGQRLYNALASSDSEGLNHLVIAFGVFFGDELVKRGPFEWVAVKDSYGIDPVIAHVISKAHASPIAAIHKRVSGHEEWDIEQLLTLISNDLKKFIKP